LKKLVFCLALLSPCVAAALDLSTQLIGTRVAGDFTLGPALFRLPEGEWVLAARHTWTGTMNVVQEGPKWAGVFLFDVRGTQVARAVLATTNVEAVQGNRGWRWTEDPCKRREDVHLHRDLSSNYQNQFCVQVNHRVPFLVERKGWTRDANAWLAERSLQAPQTAMAVQYARIDRAYQTLLHYYFNPEVDGVAPAASRTWKESEWHRQRVASDPARAAYVDALVKWAGDAAYPVQAGFAGKPEAVFPPAPFPAKR
jgi:hypothetical protein